MLRFFRIVSQKRMISSYTGFFNKGRLSCMLQNQYLAAKR